MLESDDGIQLRGFSLRDVIGRNVICEDGVTRRVQQISYSHRFPTHVLINEVEEEETPGGAWVHGLSLACQMHKLPLPTKEQKEAFNRTMSAIRFTPDSSDGRQQIVTPSGIILSKTN